MIDQPEFEKIIIEKPIEKEVKHGIPYATRKLNYNFHHSNEIFLTSSIKFSCKVESRFTLHLAKFGGNWPSSSGDNKL